MPTNKKKPFMNMNI